MPANIDNLKVPTSEQARIYGAKGGKASVESKRRKKTIREYIDVFLSLPLNNKEQADKLAEYGIDPEEVDNQMAMVIAIWQKALCGDVSAFNTLRDTIGEKPKEIMTLESDDLTGIKIKFVDKTGANQKKEKDPKICGDYTPPSNYKET